MTDVFSRCGWEIRYRSPYFPDLNPCDFGFIRKMMEPLHGISFHTIPEILQAVDCSIWRITKTASKSVLDNAGFYFEGL